MSDGKRTRLMSLTNRILIYTALPVLVILIAAGVFTVLSLRSVIDSVSRSEAVGSTELACSRVEDVISEYADVLSRKSSDENIRRFLYTAEDRDGIDSNAYFSYAIGGLDSTLSEEPDMYERMWIASAKHPGVAFSNSSQGWTAPPDFDLSALPFYGYAADSAASGNTGGFITSPYASPVSGRTEVSVIVSVKDARTGEFLGVIGADIDLDGLWKSISALPEAEMNDLYVISKDMSVIYSPDINKLLHSRDELRIQEIKDSRGNSYTDGKRELVGSWDKTEYDWTVCALRDFSDTAEFISLRSRITALSFAAAAAVMLITLFICARRIARPIQEYTEKINALCIDKEDGGSEVLSPEGSKELEELAIGFNSLISRNREIMTSLSEMSLGLEKEMKLYQTALQSSSDIVFEYDIKQDTLITYGSIFDSTAPKTISNVITGFVGSVIKGDSFASDDIEAVKRFFGGNTKNEAVISFMRSNGTTCWISFSGAPVPEDAEPVKVVGKISCIDDVMSLREYVKLDRFTGLYNKTAAEKLISKRLEGGGSYAAIVVDVDNFKSVNDILGHAYGDFVIKDIAAKLKAVIRAEDIAGRIGGDEFMLFISGEDSRERAEEICKAVCGSIRHTYSDESGEQQVGVSASVGAALCPVHGTDFEKLYSSADIAMYISKCGGKDRYTVYDGQERPHYSGRD